MCIKMSRLVHRSTGNVRDIQSALYHTRVSIISYGFRNLTNVQIVTTQTLNLNAGRTTSIKKEK